MTNWRHEVPAVHTDFVFFNVEALRRIFEFAEAVDLRAAESDKSEIAHEALLRAIVPLLDEAYAVIGRVAARFDEAGGEDAARTNVADIAALAGMALQERRNLLTHAQPCDHWTYLENCERSMRSLRKSVAVVEGALTRYGHLPPRVDRARDLDRALRVRRRYATLRREIARASAQQLDIQPRLRAVSRSIAALLSCDEFPSMRLGDRRELRRLQFQIQSWLSVERPSEVLGERTWEEVIAVVNLISAVNRRSELVAHDARVLGELVAVAESAHGPQLLRATAEPLFGMDPALDLLLDIHVPESNDRERWREVLAQLAAERETPRIARPEAAEQPAHSAAP